MRNKITNVIHKLACKNKKEAAKVKPSQLMQIFQNALHDPYWAEKDLLRTLLR